MGRRNCPVIFLFFFWGVFEGSHLFPGAIPSRRSGTGPEDELEADRRLFPEAISTSLLNESCRGDVEDDTLERQAVRNCPFCIQLSSPFWSTVVFDR